jgi:hypothetical protein
LSAAHVPPSDFPVGAGFVNVSFTNGSFSLTGQTNPSQLENFGVQAFLPAGDYVFTASFDPDSSPYYSNPDGHGPPTVRTNLHVPAVADQTPTTFDVIRINGLDPSDADYGRLIENETATVSTILRTLAGVPVAGEAVEFSLAGLVATAITDSNGQAFALFASVAVPPGGYSLSAHFAETSYLTPATRAVSVKVLRKMAVTINRVDFVPLIQNNRRAVDVSLTVMPAGGLGFGESLTVSFTSPGYSLTATKFPTVFSGFGVQALLPPGDYVFTAVMDNPFYTNADGRGVASGTTTFNVPRFNTSLSPVTVTRAVVGDLSAFTVLTADSGPIANAPVVFTLNTLAAGAPTTVSAMTDGTGRASVSIPVSQATSYLLDASYAGDSTFNASVAAPPLAGVIEPAATSFSSIMLHFGAFAGAPFTVSSFLSAGSGYDVTFTLTAPDGSTTQQSVITANSGSASATFMPAAGGAHIMTVHFAGSDSFTASTATKTIGVVQATQLTMPAAFNALPTVPITLRATLLAVPGEVPLSGQLVDFTFTGDGAPASQSATTDANGVAKVTVAFANTGTFTTRASFPDRGEFLLSSEASATITAERMMTSITPTFTTSVDAGSEVVLSARLRDVNGPVAGATLAFQLDATTKTAITDSLGNASASFTSGCAAHSITITFAGDPIREPVASAPHTILVFDRTAPVITPPISMTIGTNDACSFAGAIGTATTTDNCSPVSITNDAPAAFALGATTVTWKATDAAGNVATAIQRITVFDDDKPSVTAPPPLTLNATGPGCGLAVSDTILGTAIATDECPGAVNVTRTGVPAGGFLPIGTTIITYTATDQKGNSSDAIQIVTVVDVAAPNLIVSLSPIGKMKKTSGAFQIGIIATDNCEVRTANAMIPIPSGSQGFAIRTNNSSQSSISIDFDKRQITLSGKDQTTLRALLQQIASQGGVAVAHGQTIAMERDAKKALELQFTGGVLSGIIAPNPTVRAVAADGSGNTAVAVAAPVFE